MGQVERTLPKPDKCESEGNAALERLKAGSRKVELGVRAIQHLRVGYILIMLTPVLSFTVLLLLIGVTAALLPIQEYLLPILGLTAWNVLILVLLIIGVSLYLYGYQRQQATDAEAPWKWILLSSFFPILWGVFTYFFASWFYSDIIDWSMNPGMRALTIWDHMEYWTWELKGILWIGAGLLLKVTSLVRMHAH